MVEWKEERIRGLSSLFMSMSAVDSSQAVEGSRTKENVPGVLSAMDAHDFNRISCFFFFFNLAHSSQF